MKHYAFCSFGKDSMATVLLALQHGEPLDGVIHCETMYDNKRGISAEMPEQAEWIHKVAIPRLEQMGAKVIIHRSPYDMLTLFHRTRERGEYKGMANGYPMRGKCYVEGYCKTKQIHTLKQQLGEFIEYVGIAADEEVRLRRLTGRKVSLLAKYGVTEAQAMQMCKDAGLLSPTYEYTHRGGCFFCPSATINELHHFAKTCPELWEEVLQLEHTPNIIGRSLKQDISNDELRRKVSEFVEVDSNVKRFVLDDPDEKWVEVEGTDGMYRISSKCRIFSVARRQIVAQTLTPTGRLSVVFTIGKKQTRRLVEDVFKKHFPNETKDINGQHPARLCRLQQART